MDVNIRKLKAGLHSGYSSKEQILGWFVLIGNKYLDIRT